VTDRVNLEVEVADLLRRKLEEFADWCGRHWILTEDQAAKDETFSAKPPAYREGHNDAVTSMRGAVDCFLEAP
jgi:hypothetical protein